MKAENGFAKCGDSKLLSGSLNLVKIFGYSFVVLVSSALADPAVLFTDVESGPLAGGPNGLGVPIAIFGKGFGTSRGSSKVTIGGVEVAAYNVWGASNAKNSTLDMIEVQPGAGTAGGAIVVTVNGKPSNSNYSFTVNSGKIRAIAKNGSDSNPCTLAAPCATILHSVEPSVSAPGDTILIRAGTYSEGEMWIRRENNHGGSLGQQKTIKEHDVSAAAAVSAAASDISASGPQRH